MRVQGEIGIEYCREDFIAPLSSLLGSKGIDQDGDGFALTWQYVESGKVLLDVNLYHNTMVVSCDLIEGGMLDVRTQVSAYLIGTVPRQVIGLIATMW